MASITSRIGLAQERETLQVGGRVWPDLLCQVAVLLVVVFGVGCQMAAAQVGQIQANGITIAYESIGPAKGEPVLLIAGTGRQMIEWPPELCQQLAKKGYRVLRYDNRDCGLSTSFDSAGLPDWGAITTAMGAKKPVPLAYTIDDMARDAVGLLDALRLPKAHIVGVSMGGMIAQIVAARYPDRTMSLTSIMATDGKPGLPLPAKPEVMAKAPTTLPAAGDTAGAVTYGLLTAQVLGSPDYPTAEANLRQQARQAVKRSYRPAGTQRHMAASLVENFHDRRTELQTIKAPTVVVHGAADPLVPVEAGQDVAANIPGAELVVIPGMGHELPVQVVPQVADTIARVAVRAKKPSQRK